MYWHKIELGKGPLASGHLKSVCLINTRTFLRLYDHFLNLNSFFLPSAKNIFRVRFQDPCPGQSHTLQANDVFHKQQWFNCIRSAIAPFQRAASPLELQGLPELHEECEENNPPAGNLQAQRRSSMVPGLMQVDSESALECGSSVQTEDTKSGKAHRAQPGLRRARDKAQSGGNRKETLV